MTPKIDDKNLKSEYENLQQIINERHNSVWIYWDNEDDKDSVVGLIRSILEKELKAEINPINEYMRHTLKSFVNFISTSIKASDRKVIVGDDIGLIKDDITITLKDGNEYRIIRRDSSQIQVYNLKSEEKENAKHIMALYIDENKLDIEHKKYNTRAIGKKLQCSPTKYTIIVILLNKDVF